MSAAMFVMFEIFLVLIISAALYQQYANIENKGIYETKFISRDLALILDAAYGSGGNMKYVYNPASLAKFTYSFDGNNVVVDGESYPYGSDQSVLSKFRSFSKPVLLFVYKEGSSLEISDVSREINPNYVPCDSTIVPEIRSVTIDPSRGWNAELAKHGSLMPGEKGFVNTAKNWTESKVAMDLSNVLATRYLPGKVSKIDATRSVKADMNLAMAGRKKKIAEFNNDALISIRAGSSINKDGTPNVADRDVIAYVNFESPAFKQSRKLACLVLNQMSESLKEITGTAVVPVLLSQYDEDDPLQVLSTDKIAVQLEIGNIQVSENNFLVEKRGEIASAITQAINPK